MPRKHQSCPHYARTFEELAEDVFLSTNPKNALYNCHSSLFKQLMEYKPAGSFLSTYLHTEGKEAVIAYILLVSHACGEPDTPRFKNRNTWDTSIEVSPSNPVAYAAAHGNLAD